MRNGDKISSKSIAKMENEQTPQVSQPLPPSPPLAEDLSDTHPTKNKSVKSNILKFGLILILSAAIVVLSFLASGFANLDVGGTNKNFVDTGLSIGLLTLLVGFAWIFRGQLNKILYFGLIFVLLIPLVLVGKIAVSCNNKISSTNHQSDKYKKELESLSIFDTIGTPPKTPQLYDCSSNDLNQLYAGSSYRLTGKISVLDSEAITSLEKQGFTRDNTFYDGGKISEDIRSLTFKYTRDDEKLYITYNFARDYQCPKNYICYNNGELSQQELSKVYPVKGFADIQISSAVIKLMNISSSQNYFY